MDILRQMGTDRDADFLRDGAQLLTQRLIELEETERTGAKSHERASERSTSRNRHRDRSWETRAGELDLKIPKLRKGTFFPSFLKPRKMTEKAILSVVQEAYISGVSTRKVDDLVRALCLYGIDRSEVSRTARALDEEVNLFLSRPLEGPYPYVWLDATYLKLRSDHRIVSKALVISLGGKMTSEREILGFAIGPCESEPFRHESVKGLVSRGLGKLNLVISNVHEGLKKGKRQMSLPKPSSAAAHREGRWVSCLLGSAERSSAEPVG